MVETGNWHFNVESDEYGSEIFGPYDSFFEAMKGVSRIQRAARKDDVERRYSNIYQLREEIYDER
jgi:hypothetical protein